MTNLTPDLQEGWRESLTDCRAQQCNSHGDCVTVNGFSACECVLGYVGDNCEDTVNGGLAIPLLLGVLGVLFGFIVLAFLFAHFRQKRKAQKREQTDEKKTVLLLPSP